MSAPQKLVTAGSAGHRFSSISQRTHSPKQGGGQVALAIHLYFVTGFHHGTLAGIGAAGSPGLLNSGLVKELVKESSGEHKS
jgi:hypothetical protein